MFDVELDSGAKLKLAMDAHENPYIVADRFLLEYDLPAEFKEQVGAARRARGGRGKGGRAARKGRWGGGKGGRGAHMRSLQS